MRLEIKFDEEPTLLKYTNELREFYNNPKNIVTAALIRKEFLALLNKEDNRKVTKMLADCETGASNDLNNTNYKLISQFWIDPEAEKEQAEEDEEYNKNKNNANKRNQKRKRKVGRPKKQQPAKVELPSKNYYASTVDYYTQCRASKNYNDNFILTTNEKCFSTTVTETDTMYAIRQGILPKWWIMMERTLMLLNELCPIVKELYLDTNPNKHMLLKTQEAWVKVKELFRSMSYNATK